MERFLFMLLALSNDNHSQILQFLKNFSCNNSDEYKTQHKTAVKVRSPTGETDRKLRDLSLHNL